MNWKNKKVLITGAGGFIGSHLTERLVGLGANVRALVHYNALGTWGWLDQSPVKNKIEVVAGDICDRDSMCRAVEGREIVFHLAALIAIPYSYHAPASYIRTNVEGTLNVLQAARKAKVKCVIHTSTSEVYGTAQSVPIAETHPLQGQSPYSASKIGADKIAEAFHLSFGLPVVTVRPFNTFGPRQSARAIIPTIITQLLAGKKVKLGNVTPTRDLNYVANTVEGFVLAASMQAAVGKTINIGSEREISILELAQMIGRLMKKPLKIETENQRVRPDRSEVERLLADNRLAREVLGWAPQVGLEDGLKRTIEWMRQNSGRYRSGGYVV
ncbi:MAG: GDP-mannose 4,6-dehydratase [Verrucomicrobia bacterium]|nr:GDP-mannose 4,6-dehydratase [Verrucomicrobiota bacterium]MBU4248031.1 GDP-mannose 4,6-dehydratase [Verrucomicrobiota bacterium]MBU4289531.1 GDP-mannose 4,6-dehydratase [Verrucomicrobiota bacterium]MBU4496512.1 GDP-mannose 4,6-dehydratase [Verrucomicrobiota bacterium]MCG2678525.1 GDP-mannose 4,6-dehydratase [Kiritimatiellia bacterium]